jgi:hypothetical protein
MKNSGADITVFLLHKLITVAGVIVLLLHKHEKFMCRYPCTPITEVSSFRMQISLYSYYISMLISGADIRVLLLHKNVNFGCRYPCTPITQAR